MLTAIDLIISFEGFRANAYKPSPNDKWTVGYGFTNINGKPVKPNNTITEADAKIYLQYLVSNLNYEMESKYRTWGTLKVNQKIALLSLIFNIGIGAFERSSMGALLSVNKLMNIPTRILLWCNGPHGDKDPGLLKRRQLEASIFKGEQNEQIDSTALA